MTERIPTDRLITVLNSVNCTAIDNDGGSPGAYLAKMCHAAAARLKELHLVEQKALALAGKPVKVVKPLDGQLDLVEYIDKCSLLGLGNDTIIMDDIYYNASPEDRESARKFWEEALAARTVKVLYDGEPQP